MRRACTPYPVNSAALVAAEAAIRDPRFLRNYTREVLQSRAMLEKGLVRLGARIYPSSANFVLADFGPVAQRLVRALERKGILVRGRQRFSARGFRSHQRRHARRYAQSAPGHGRNPVKLAPKLIIFDVDGVLVDVHGSFHKSIIDTVHFFTGKRVTYAEIHQWKNRSGYNDDWRLTTDWIASLGPAVPYEEVKARFQKFYWGTKSSPAMWRGNAGWSRTSAWSAGRAAPNLRSLPAARARNCATRWRARTRTIFFAGRLPWTT